jgi:hypothetical protein
MRDDGLQAIPHSVGTRHPADTTLQNKAGSPPFTRSMRTRAPLDRGSADFGQITRFWQTARQKA